jgi:hypothetical protein
MPRPLCPRCRKRQVTGRVSGLTVGLCGTCGTIQLARRALWGRGYGLALELRERRKAARGQAR